jgi:hypothetical protein
VAVAQISRYALASGSSRCTNQPGRRGDLASGSAGSNCGPVSNPKCNRPLKNGTDYPRAAKSRRDVAPRTKPSSPNGSPRKKPPTSPPQRAAGKPKSVQPAHQPERVSVRFAGVWWPGGMFHVKHFPRESDRFVLCSRENRVHENFRGAICSVSIAGHRGKHGGVAIAWEQTSENKRTIQRVWSRTELFCSAKTSGNSGLNVPGPMCSRELSTHGSRRTTVVITEPQRHGESAKKARKAGSAPRQIP